MKDQPENMPIQQCKQSDITVQSTYASCTIKKHTVRERLLDYMRQQRIGIITVIGWAKYWTCE